MKAVRKHNGYVLQNASQKILHVDHRVYTGYVIAVTKIKNL
jgi:hypothetical protein